MKAPLTPDLIHALVGPAACPEMPFDKADLRTALDALPWPCPPELARILPLVVSAIGGPSEFEHQFGDAWGVIAPVYRQMVSAAITQMHWLENFVAEIMPQESSVILLKGAAFFGTLYPPQEARPAADIDLLVQACDFEPLSQLLEQIGTRVPLHPGKPYSHKRYFERKFLLPHHVPCCVEVHRCLTQDSAFRIDVDDLFQRSQIHPHFQLPNVRMLSPVDTLLHLVVHSYRHLDIPLHSVVDILRILWRWSPDRADVAKRARSWGAANLLSIVLAHILERYSTSVPASWQNVDHVGPGRRALVNATFAYGDSPMKDRLGQRSRQFLSLGLLDSPTQGFTHALDFLSRRGADLFLNGLGRMPWSQIGKKGAPRD